eukprot:3675160-Pleurochrysis_carterae.AAC.1
MGLCAVAFNSKSLRTGLLAFKAQLDEWLDSRHGAKRKAALEAKLSSRTLLIAWPCFWRTGNAAHRHILCTTRQSLVVTRLVASL